MYITEKSITKLSPYFVSFILWTINQVAESLVHYTDMPQATMDIGWSRKAVLIADNDIRAASIREDGTVLLV